MTSAHRKSSDKNRAKAGMRHMIYYMQMQGFVYQTQKFSVIQAEFERITGLKKPEKLKFRQWALHLYDTKSKFLLKPPVVKRAPKTAIKKEKKERPKIRKALYNEYLSSQKWKDFRESALDFYGRFCMVCGKTHILHIHHKHYKTLFNERFEDVIVLCKSCHEEKHGRKFI